MPIPENMLIAHGITAPLKEGGKDRWDEVGVAFMNKNGTISLDLRCIPLSGRIVLQKPSAKPTTEAAS